MKIWFLLFVFAFLFLPSIHAECNSTQIDINTATAKQLDRIIWVGNATAQLIIDYRTKNQSFSLVDDLINLKGIGTKKLSDIKTQGLACVSDEILIAENKTSVIENKTNYSDNVNPAQLSGDVVEKPNVNMSPIVLSPKDIKSGNFFEFDKDKIAFFGLAGFLILISFLFWFKKFGARKNEF